MQQVYHSNATTNIHIRQQLQAAVSVSNCTMACVQNRVHQKRMEWWKESMGQ